MLPFISSSFTDSKFGIIAESLKFDSLKFIFNANNIDCTLFAINFPPSILKNPFP